MKRNATIFLLLLVTEVAIALFHFNKFIRGFVGDVLVIPLLHFLIKIFWKAPSYKLIIAIYLFAIFVEILQLVQLPKKLGITSKLIQTIVGTTFDWNDIIAYTLGALLLILIAKLWKL